MSNCTLSLFRFPPPRSAGASDATEGEKPPRAPASDRGGRRKRTLPVLSAKPKESPATARRSQKNAPLCRAHNQPEHRQHGLCPSRLLRPERRLGYSGRNDDSASCAGRRLGFLRRTTNRLLWPERTTRLLRPERVDFSGPFGVCELVRKRELVRARQPPIVAQLLDPVPDAPRGLATLAVPPVLH